MNALTISNHPRQSTFRNLSTTVAQSVLLLSASVVPSIYLFFYLARARPSYSSFGLLAAHPLFKGCLIVWIWSCSYYVFSEILYLVPDTSHQFERKLMAVTGWLIIVGPFVLAILGWMLQFKL